MARRPERNHEAYNESGLLNLGLTSLDIIITIWAYQVENETHLLLDCSKYSSQRRTFLNRINESMPNLERKSTSESIKLLMNSNDYHVNKLVMKFISSCMNVRDTLLQSSETDIT